MTKRLFNSSNASLTKRIGKLNAKNTGIVIDVILDDTSDKIEEYDFSEVETKDTTLIGCAIIRTLNDQSSATESLRAYAPMNPEDGVPLKNETVQLFTLANRLYYKRIFDANISIGNANLNREKNFLPEKQNDSPNSNSYGEVSTTKTPKSSGGSTEESDFGNYFKQQQIHPLKLYEGDKLIQSRFGQSIRFSGYNNSENSFAPTILIRNRQNSEIEANEKPGKVIEEDINKEGSVILLTSGDYQIDLKPGTIDDGGSQQLETKPNKFEEYPTELKGNDQILINSERIILSSKSKEMIFFSKGNYGFISDGKFSIDNGKAGAELDFNGEFRMTMNDNPTYLLGQGTSGKIFLNITDETEPLVRGTTLKDLLTALINEILVMVWATPAGPTAPGPLPPHVQKLNEIKTDLQTMLSTTNFTE